MKMVNTRQPWFLILFFMAGCSGNSDSGDSTPVATPPASITPLINFTVVDYSFHDTASFTEGLLFHDGQLYESTGHTEELPFSRSLFGPVDSHTGKISPKVEKSGYFGEGIAFLKGRVYQLTYKTQIGFVYDAKTFRQLDSFRYANKEGWGLTTDGRQLIMSDGTDELSFIDPADLKDPARSPRKLKVTKNGIPRDSLNELEYIKGFIYANIWLNDHIVKIDPSSGKVVGELDLGYLAFQAKQKHPGAEALNGIAYDSVADKVYVTGKLWPDIYQISFVH